MTDGNGREDAELPATSSEYVYGNGAVPKEVKAEYADLLDPPAPTLVRRDRIFMKPRKLDDIVEQRLVEAVGKGASYEIAAGYANISYLSLAAWLASGYDIDQILIKENPRPAERRIWERNTTYLLFKKLKQAAAEAAMKWIGDIDKAADNDWRAAWAMLQARHPESYGRQIREIHIGKAVRDEAEKVAKEMGIDYDELLAAAQALAIEDAGHPDGE